MTRSRNLTSLVALATWATTMAGPATDGSAAGSPVSARPVNLAPPAEKDGWIAPAQGQPSQPIWGIKGGIEVGLWPLRGPRGLIRVYAPYLGNPAGHVINFIAVEPIAGARRDLSELQESALDGVPGKRMWTGTEMEESPAPREPWAPAQPKFMRVGGGEAMTFFVFVEPFQNGARPIVQVILRKDRPREVSFRVFTAKGGAAMKACVLTATMGNYARLRRLWLKDEVVESTRLWPGFVPADPRAGGFARAKQWGVERLARAGQDAIVAATPDETDPQKAAYAPNTPATWRYEGLTATQYWRAKAAPGLVARANGRRTYWSSNIEIPRGVAFENFELLAPFAPGQEFTFGVTPDPPDRVMTSD